MEKELKINRKIHKEFTDVWGTRFPGEMPTTFKKKHIVEVKQNEYSVMPKFDGVRYLLYISSSGKSYFIDRNMTFNLSFLAPAPEMKGVLLDGELMTGKSGQKTYIVFDILSDKKGSRYLDRYNTLAHKVHALQRYTTPASMLRIQVVDALHNNVMNMSSFLYNISQKYNQVDGLVFRRHSDAYR